MTTNDMKDWKGLRLTVYRAAHAVDTTNGGITATADHVTVVGIKRNGQLRRLPARAQVFPAEPGHAPAVVLVESALPAMYGPHLEPLVWPYDRVGPMAGGNFAASSDSRWADLGKEFASEAQKRAGLMPRLDVVAVHDRFETQSQYDALSI